MSLGQASFKNSEKKGRKQQVDTRPEWKPAGEAVSRKREREIIPV